jgi:FixJ family two-component response regulator
VDDDPLLRALFDRIGERGEFDVATYANANDLLANLEPATPGCIVVDLVLQDQSGLDILRALAARDCRLPVVVMSGMARAAEAVTAIKLGGFDFVEKPFRVEEMIATLHRATDADRDRRRAAVDAARLRSRFQRLTPREVEVMERIVRGAANKEVAAELGLSPKTVEVHRANIMRKTQAGSLAELVRLHVAIRG